MIGTQLSHFKITAKLGEGGMGEVYRAEDTKLGREVALKVLPEDFTADAERLARFEREAQVLAALNHPNIAGIHEIGEGTDEARRTVRFLAMELAEGEDLAGHLAKGAIPLETALPIALQVAQGLEVAHDRGIVHRDLKPANVMVGPDRQVKILDFGLAKAFAQEAASGQSSLSMSPTLTAQMTQAGTLLGTAAYMSPEQARGEARIAIEDYLTAPEAEERAVASEVSPPARWKHLLPWAVAATVSALALGSAFLRTEPTPTEATRSTILAPAGTDFDLGGQPGVVAVSPGGRSLAFSAIDTEGEKVLFVRDLKDLEARPLPGTEGASYPFWSPDGRFVAFFAEGKLKKVEKSGGPPITIVSAWNGKGGTWSPAGVIVFAPEHESALFRVSAAGGEATEITDVDRDRFNSHRHPQFLPDGEHFLFLARSGVDGEAESRIMIGSLGGEAPVDLFASAAGALYAAGHILFLVEGNLLAQPFDPNSLETTGERFSIAEDVALVPGTAKGAFSVSDGGTLAYHAGKVSSDSELRWIDRSGAIGDTFGERDEYSELHLSPDGAHALVAISDLELGTQDLWILDLERGLRERFTFDPGWELFPAWSPDGERIAFAWSRSGNAGSQIRVRSILTGEEEILLEGDLLLLPYHWSPDGQYLAYVTRGTETGFDLNITDLLSGGEPIPLQPSRFDEGSPRISPDGRWLAYVNNASGRREIYVTAFPAGGRKWQVSSDGGRWPVWDPSGTSLYWLTEEALMGAEVDGSGQIFRVGTVSKIVDEVRHKGWWPYPYDITPDGQRFLVNVRADTSTPPLTLVLGFPAELRSDNP